MSELTQEKMKESILVRTLIIGTISMVLLILLYDAGDLRAATKPIPEDGPAQGTIKTKLEPKTTLAAKTTLAGKTTIFPTTVYLEETATGTSLQFELCFAVNKPCSPFIVLFKYMDKDGKTLLYRRLVNHSIADIERFTAVFNKVNKLRLGDSTLKTGDFCIITHPYGEYNWSKMDIASVECTAYLKGEETGRVEAVTWNVTVETYEPAEELELPFKGLWWHLEGHDTYSHHRRIFHKRNTNYFACDLMKTDASQAICSGTGTSNEDFFSYGEPILAAANGTIVKVIDGIDDNPAGGRAESFNPASPEGAGGNTVIIKHGDSMFTYYGHLKKGSLKVKEGQIVKSGDTLGLCGNSGNSDAPHLHFHVANNPSLQCLTGSGLPPVFKEFKMMEGGKLKTIRGKALFAGETVSP